MSSDDQVFRLPSSTADAGARRWKRLQRSAVDFFCFILSEPSLAAGVGMFVILLLATTIGPLVYAIDPQATSADVLDPPSAEHWLGTDSVGRDLLVRLFYGAQSSVLIAIASTASAMTLGTLLGVTAGFLGGTVDWIEMRIIDVLLSVPTLLVAIAVLAAVGPSIPTLITVLVLTYTPQAVRVVRASTFQVARLLYIDSARISGLPPIKIMWTHVLRNIRSVLIVQATVTVAHMMLVETILSFLGLGVQPPTPSLGFMVAEGRQWMELAPMVVLAPGIAIVYAVSAFTFIGHGLDQALTKRT